MSTSVDKKSGPLDHLRALLDHSLDAVLVVELDSTSILDANANATELLGHDRATLARKTLEDIIDEAGFREILAVWRTSRNQHAHLSAMVLTARNRTIPVNLTASIDWQGDFEVGIVTLRPAQIQTSPSQPKDDARVCETAEREDSQRQLRDHEDQMRQAQKLQSLGVLAGGIAHDFNNLLTGIMGYASLAVHALEEEDSPTLKDVIEIQKIAERAAELTKQMLTYSGKDKFVVAPLNLSQIVEELTHFLRISVSKKARLLSDFSDDLPAIEADTAQVQRIVMNLITNASEALEDEKGDIKVSTGVISASREYLADSCLDTALPAGRYVYVEVTDTGCGMNEETIAKIFDPFFTTKITGRGLGMAAALGIMRGHKGTIKIDSSPGVGTTMRLLFPCLQRDTENQPLPLPENSDNSQPDWQGRGMVLIADDEEFVRDMAGAILRSVGYSVKTAVDGRDCLEDYDRHRENVVAIILDLTMPRMNGVEVLCELRGRGERVPVVLSSGYEVQEAKKRLNGEHFEAFLQKPYLRTALIETIRQVVTA